MLGARNLKNISLLKLIVTLSKAGTKFTVKTHPRTDFALRSASCAHARFVGLTPPPHAVYWLFIAARRPMDGRRKEEGVMAVGERTHSLGGPKGFVLVIFDFQSK